MHSLLISHSSNNTYCMKITILPQPGKQFNPSDIQRLFPSHTSSRNSNGYMFRGKLQVVVNATGVVVSGDVDAMIKNDFRPVLESLLKLNNFGKATNDKGITATDARKLLE